MNWQERISVNAAVRGGKPCIRGTRITVYDVLEYLAGGMSEDKVSGQLSRPYARRYSSLPGLRGGAGAAPFELRSVRLLFDENLSAELPRMLASECSADVFFTSAALS